jgi:ribosomal protein L30E
MFLGLTEKAGYLVIGEESCGMSARGKKAKVILTASDASRNSTVRAKSYAEVSKAPHVELPFSKTELGMIVGRGMPGMLAITDIGMASAFLKKLSAEYPGEYDLACGLLMYSADRASQRKAEAKRHKENIRRGKKKN